MVGFSGILCTGMMKGKLIDENKLSVGLGVN